MTHCRALAILLVVALGLLPVVPPVHVHERSDHDDVHETVAHRHASLHVPQVHGDQDDDSNRHASAERHEAQREFDDVPEFDHDARVVAQLATVLTLPEEVTTPGPVVAVTRIVALEPDLRGESIEAPFVERQIHGPPTTPSAPRPPPLLSYL